MYLKEGTDDLYNLNNLATKTVNYNVFSTTYTDPWFRHGEMLTSTDCFYHVGYQTTIQTGFVEYECAP